jgi:hypothetical protein
MTKIGLTIASIIISSCPLIKYVHYVHYDHPYRAYSSVHDKTARWPEYNFTDCVDYTLKNPGIENFDVLLMSAPTVDISNMDTSKMNPKDSTETFQLNARKSSHNMFRLAERSLRQNNNLKKVIILEHPPRFDQTDVDPTSLKPALARLANATLGKLWLNSKLKDKIVIGHHSLESSGAGDAHKARYVNPKTGKYDGVHLYGVTGCKDYANSLKSIMMLALPEQNKSECGTAQVDEHITCPQAKYQKKRTVSSVPTKNRFSVLKSNSGNW